MIREDYCSYEVAKLLKEKRFDWMCNGYYNKDDEDSEPYFGDGEGADNWNNQAPSVRDLWFSAPTHQMAMKWLREEHKIFIEVSVCIDTNGDYHYHSMALDKICEYILPSIGTYDTYEEAIESALKYVLEKIDLT